MHGKICVMVSLILTFGFSNAALAQQQSGGTSGPAVRQNVEPPTVTEKRYEGRSMKPQEGNPATGMPGVEGKPGTESGQVSPEAVPIR
jgi:hypothetical protein